MNIYIYIMEFIPPTPPTPQLQVINLEDLWVNLNENQTFPHNGEQVYLNTEDSSGFYDRSISIPFILRYLLFCDQCHDFCEKAERNNLRDIQTQTHDILAESYRQDMLWLTQKISAKQFNVNDTNHIRKLFSTMNLVMSDTDLAIYYDNPSLSKEQFFVTEKMKIHIQKILHEFLNITTLSSFDIAEAAKQRSCSGSWNRLKEILLNLNSTQIQNRNQWNITVDADKSKINLGSMLLYFCDQLNSNPGTIINLYDTYATQYDAASGSGTFSYLNKVNNNLNDIANKDEHGTVNDIIAKNPNGIQIQIKYYDIIVLDFTYYTVTIPQEDPALNLLWGLFRPMFDNIDTLLVNINNEQFAPRGGITNDKISELKNIIYDLAKELGIPIQKKIPLGTAIPDCTPVQNVSFTSSGSKPVLSEWNTNAATKLQLQNPKQLQIIFLWTIIYNILIPAKPDFLDLLQEQVANKIVQKTILRMNINQFFSKEPNREHGQLVSDVFAQTNTQINENNADVSTISAQLANLAKPGNEQQFINEVTSTVCYKTLGDFGQIANYYVALRENGNDDQQDLFITFDGICSLISSLFLRYTIFENLDSGQAMAPITLYVKDRKKQKLLEALEGLMALSRFGDVCKFGKYNRRKRLPELTYRRKNTRTRQSTKTRKNTKKKIKHS